MRQRNEAIPPKKLRANPKQILSRWSVAETIFPKEKSEALILQNLVNPV